MDSQQQACVRCGRGEGDGVTGRVAYGVRVPRGVRGPNEPRYRLEGWQEGCVCTACLWEQRRSAFSMIAVAFTPQFGLLIYVLLLNSPLPLAAVAVLLIGLGACFAIFLWVMWRTLVYACHPEEVASDVLGEQVRRGLRAQGHEMVWTVREYQRRRKGIQG